MNYSGFLIRSRRLARSWSQEGLCRGICTVSYLSKIEQGKAEPSPEIVSALLGRLGLPWYDGGEDLHRARGLAERMYEALFSCEWAALEGLWAEAEGSWERLANGPFAPDFFLLQVLAGPQPRRPLDPALEACLNERQLAVQRVLQGRSEEAVRLFPCGWTYLTAGIEAYEKGENTAALGWLQTGNQLAAQEGRPCVMLECRMYLGNCCSSWRDMETMRTHYQVAGRLARALGDKRVLRAIGYNIASTQLENGDSESALGYFAALKCPDRMDLHKLAICYEKQGRPAEALAALQRVESAPPSDAVSEALTRQMCGVVRYRLEHPQYLQDDAYGRLLLACFEECQRWLPAGYAGFHLPWVLEWYAASRQYKQAYELLRQFSEFS